MRLVVRFHGLSRRLQLTPLICVQTGICSGYNLHLFGVDATLFTSTGPRNPAKSAAKPLRLANFGAV